MSPWTFALVCCIGFIVSGTLFVRVMLQTRDLSWETTPDPMRSFLKVSGALTLCCVIGLFVMVGGSEVILNQDVALEVGDDGRVTRASNEAIWCFLHCASLPLSVEASSKVHPITENPKVRGLSYTLVTHIVDAKVFLDGVKIPVVYEDRAVERTRRFADIHRRRVEYLLYEFNNAHSKELALFYNPLDVRQRRGLEALLHSSIDDALEQQGIKFEKLVSFDVE